MIPVKELMIDNWINDKEGTDFYFQVEARHFMSGSISHFRPIKITPQLLEKIGFEKQNYALSYVIYKKYVGEDCFYFEFKFYRNDVKTKDCCMLCGNGGYDDEGEMEITESCKYIHQLQNIHFSLTGIELILNKEMFQ